MIVFGGFPPTTFEQMTEPDRDARIARSWTANAGAWTRAVREALIPSRVAGTDEAIMVAVRRWAPASVLDTGCGEGWLARALASEGHAVVGVDGSAPLIEKARESGGARYLVLTYDEILADPSRLGGPYDVVVLNFALFAERVAPLLAALASRLSPSGALVIQTLHPWSAAGEDGYTDGWRVATFTGFGGPFPESMPWFFRTLSSWVREFSDAGLVVELIEEPRHPETREPLSMVMTLRRGKSPVRGTDATG